MNKLWLAVIVAISFATFACNKSQPVEAAANGALPAVEVPIGPLPGPTKATNLPQNPYRGNQVALYEGRKLFQQYNCSGCHGGHGGGGMGPSLRDKVWIYGSSDAHIFSSIAEGRAHGMPAWGTRIPEEQIWKLVTYIESMRTPQEPEAPETAPVPEAVRKGF
jgi:cytochrome c oxidase cbb3-type subunit 3